MNNTLVFWRHAETRMDKDTPVSQWDITGEGIKMSEKVVESGIFDDIDLIITSTEPKAIQTAEPCARRLSKEIIQIQELGEINRDKGGLLTKEEYKEMKRKVFNDFNYTDHGWETINEAIGRFSKSVKEIDEKYSNKKILIVAHGTVMTIYFSKVQDKLDELMDRWSGLGFCDYGVIENGSVVKDIA